MSGNMRRRVQVMMNRWPLPATAVLAVGAIMTVTSCGSGGTGRPSVATVINDGKRAVELQPSCGHVCSELKPVDLAPGEVHTWRTSDREPGIQSFTVYIPHNRSLGCLGQRGGHQVGDRATFRVSNLEECIT